MTLNKHQIRGLPNFKCTILDANQFEKLMLDAGYSISGTAPAQGNRVKVWWVHEEYPRVESIYTPDQKKVITAYHV
ncbi:hypothetical protein IQ226_20815 [Dolichospermum sp. LEGE 00240]|jgi:hypothetical protein|uniref:hypothetical protein n=1 Tax=Dolichospermum sp. LEGE 00240 TaxID=1828603 RepID=UPI0018822C22|nr:hypothetical protein [Dolichospermum sp. LEGE 00240]MBE9251525.1 hypothetical protein [Dolichospermum sp. LEGE 00240]MDM3852878.1 hypothetical protein [Aphanizomenon gracile PMC627.10]